MIMSSSNIFPNFSSGSHYAQLFESGQETSKKGDHARKRKTKLHHIWPTNFWGDMNTMLMDRQMDGHTQPSGQ